MHRNPPTESHPETSLLPLGPRITRSDACSTFTDIVVTGLTDLTTHRQAIDDILHGIRHYGAHGDSSGRTASQRKIANGEPIENDTFRLAISYVFLPITSGQLQIQIFQNGAVRPILIEQPAQDASDCGPVLRDMTASETDTYFGHLADKCMEQITAYIERTCLSSAGEAATSPECQPS